MLNSPCAGRWCDRPAEYIITSADKSQTKCFCEDHAISFYRAIRDREWDSLADMIRILCADLEKKTDAQFQSADNYWRRRFLEMISGRSARLESGIPARPKRAELEIGGGAKDNGCGDLIKRANEVLARRGKYLRNVNGEWRLEIIGNAPHVPPV